MICNLLFLIIFHLLCTIRSQQKIFTTIKVHVTDHMFCQTKVAASAVHEFDLSSLCVVKFDEKNWVHLKYNIHNLFTAPYIMYLVQSCFIQYIWSHTNL